MEILLFKTDDVEQKLFEITDYLETTKLALLGIKDWYGLSDDKVYSIETVLKESKDRLESLVKSIQIVSLNWDTDRLVEDVDCECV